MNSEPRASKTKATFQALKAKSNLNLKFLTPELLSFEDSSLLEVSRLLYYLQ